MFPICLVRVVRKYFILCSSVLYSSLLTFPESLHTGKLIVSLLMQAFGIFFVFISHFYVLSQKYSLKLGRQLISQLINTHLRLCFLNHYKLKRLCSLPLISSLLNGTAALMMSLHPGIIDVPAISHFYAVVILLLNWIPMASCHILEMGKKIAVWKQTTHKSNNLTKQLCTTNSVIVSNIYAYCK